MPTTPLTRRDALRALSALAAAGLPGPTRAADVTSPKARNMEPFALSDVRLLESEFLSAQELNKRYITALEPDRLLHNFRKNAGLTPKAPIYGGWESQEPWVEIRCHGHTLGHYLSACSMMHAATGDTVLRQRVAYVSAELKECQDASQSGLVCAFPDGASQLENSVQGKPFLGVPWYTMHKIFAGLRDAYTYTGDKTAKEVLLRLADWTFRATESLKPADFARLLEVEHGGMNEVLADVYTIGGDRKFLDLAEKFTHRAVLDPLAQERDELDGLHANTQIPKLVGANRLYDLTGKREYQVASEFFWDTVTSRRSYATGGHGDQEHFFPEREFVERLQSAKTMETCCTHNMLRLTKSLWFRFPLSKYGDYYERALYNGILASQDARSGMFTYFQATRPNYVKLYCTPHDSFWCCTGTGMENHAKYGEAIYSHTAESLRVNLFVPSTLVWKERGVTIKQTSRFPDESSVRLEFELKRPQAFELQIRKPAWCAKPSMRINGGTATEFPDPNGGYMGMAKQWKSGDVVEIDLPMHLNYEPLPTSPDIVAVTYGPLVLAARLGIKGFTPRADYIVNERTSGEMLNDPMPLPVWRAKADELASHLERIPGNQIAFRSRGIEGHEGVEFAPYFRIAHERYNLYWKMTEHSVTPA